MSGQIERNDDELARIGEKLLRGAGILPAEEAPRACPCKTLYLVSCDDTWTDSLEVDSEESARQFMKRHAIENGGLHTTFRLWRLAEHCDYSKLAEDMADAR